MYWWHTFPGYFHGSSRNPSWHCCQCRPCAPWIVEQAFGLALLPIKLPIRRSSELGSRADAVVRQPVRTPYNTVRSSTGVTGTHMQGCVWIAAFLFIFFFVPHQIAYTAVKRSQDNETHTPIARSEIDDWSDPRESAQPFPSRLHLYYYGLLLCIPPTVHQSFYSTLTELLKDAIQTANKAPGALFWLKKWTCHEWNFSRCIYISNLCFMKP